MAKTDTRKDVGTVGQPSAPLSGAETQAREVAQRTSTVRRRNRTLIIIAATLGVVLIAVLGTIAGLTLNESGDNVSAPASLAKPATTSSDVGGEGVAPAPVTAPVAPVVSAPVAPIAAEQKPAANVAQSSTSKGFASGTYKLSQITTFSSNVVVALFGAAREDSGSKALEYADRDALVRKEAGGVYPFGLLKERVHKESFLLAGQEFSLDPKEAWLLVGRLRNPLHQDIFLNPKEAAPITTYAVSTLFISPCADEPCIASQRVDLEVYKTPSGEWRISNLLVLEQSYVQERNAFEKDLARANNEPFNLK